MQKAPNTDREAKNLGLYAMGFWKWGCRCCGPKGPKERRIEHQAVRSILKQEDLFEEIFGEEDQDV